MDKLSKLWSFGLLLLPFIFYKGITVRFIYPKIIFLQSWLALGLIVLSLRKNDQSKLSLGPVSLSVLALLITAFASLTYAPDTIIGLFGPFWRGTGLVFYTSILFSIFLLVEQFKLPKDKMALWIIYSGFALSAVVLVSYFFTLNITKSLYVVIGNRNPLSFWLGMTILLSFQFRNSFSKNFKTLVYIFCSICLVELLLFGSRSSIGGLFLSFLIIGITSERKYLKYTLGAGGLTSIILLVQHFVTERSILGELISRTKSFSRLGIWQGAWDSFLTHPIFGYGFHGLIQGYWENYTSSLDKGHSWNENAHSILLNLGGELGLVGLSIFSILCFFIIKEIKNKKKVERGAWWGIFAFIVTYAITQPFFVDTVFLVGLIIFLLMEKETLSVPSKNLFYRFVKITIGVALLIISYFQYHQIDLLNKTREQFSKQGNYRKVWKTLDAEGSFIDKVGAFFEVQTLLIKNFGTSNNKETVQAKEGRIRSKRFIKEGLANLMKENSHRPRLLRSYSLNLIQENKLDEALIVLDNLLEKSDQITEVYYYKAVIFAKQRKNNESKMMLLKVKELNPNYKGINEQLAKFKN